MLRINWTFQAVSDLQTIAEFISGDSKKYAKLQVVRLRNRTKILSSQIYSGKIVTEIASQNIRELVEENYRVLNKIVSENQTNILTIQHLTRGFSVKKSGKFHNIFRGQRRAGLEEKLKNF